MESTTETALGLDEINTLRRNIASRGYRPVAVKDAKLGDKNTGKAPVRADWPDHALAGRIDVARAGVTNTGILCNGLRAVDIDIDNRDLAAFVRGYVVDLLGATIVRTRADSSRCLLVYRAAEGEPRKRILPGNKGKVEILGAGNQFVAFGLHWESLAALEWHHGSPDTTHLLDLPAITEAQITELMSELAEWIEVPAPVTVTGCNGVQPAVSSHGATADILDVTDALAVIPNDGLAEWNAWNRILMATWAATGGSDEGLEAAHAWSGKNESYDPAEVDERWKHYSKSPPKTIGAGSLFFAAREARPGWVKPSDLANRTTAAEDFAGEAPGEDTYVPPTRAQRRRIEVRMETAAEQIDQTESALIAADLGLYQSGGTLVRVGQAVDVLPTGEVVSVIRRIDVDEAHLREQIGRCTEFVRFDAKKEEWVLTRCPPDVARMYLARQSIGWTVPVLTGIVTAPTLRPDGSVLQTPGYDTATGLLFDPRGQTPPAIPAAPSMSDAKAALATLTAILTEFPFVDAASRAVALSAIITAVIRPALPTAPMHCLSATSIGTGKSFLGDVIASIATGNPVAVTPCGSNDEELEKRLGADLMSGESFIHIDNVDREINGPLLCAMITQERVKPRRLGKSENVHVLCRAFMLANGNNIPIAADMARRVVVCSMDAKSERPELRTFRGNPLAEVRANQGKYVTAVLTIVRAFITAGLPGAPDPLGGFDRWSDWVRGALMWLGEADPTETTTTARELDPARLRLSAVMHQWNEHIGCRAVTVRQIIDVAIAPGKGEFREALLIVAGVRGNIDSLRLGKWLSEQRDKLNGGMSFGSGKLRAGSRTHVLQGASDISEQAPGASAELADLVG